MADKNKIEIILTAIDQSVSRVFGQVNKAMGAADAGAGRYGRSMTALQAPLRAVTSALSGMIAAVGSGLLAKSLWDAGIQATQLDVAFKAINGSSNAAARELAFVRAEADRLGQSFPELANAYKGISAAAKGTILDGEQTHKVFSSIAEAAAALGLSGAQAEGALLAISQMISKGKVSAEELRGQLGERLPGAFGMFAESMGVSTAQLDKMLQSGEVGIETLSKFADVLHDRYGKAAEEAALGPMGALNRLSTAWFDFKVALSQSGFLDQAAGYMRSLAAALNDPATQAAIKEWATRFFELIDSVARLAWEYKGFLAGFAGTVMAASLVATLTTAFQGLAAAYKVLTGASLTAWMGSTVAAITAVDLAAMTLKTTLGAMSAILLAYGVGWQVGTLLNKFGVVQRAGAELAYGLDRAGLAAEKMWALLTGGDVAAVERKIEIAKEAIASMRQDIAAGQDTRPQATSQPAAQTSAAAALVPAAIEEPAKKDVGYRTTDYLDMLDEAVLSPEELADRKKRWAEREAQEKQLTAEKNDLFDKIAADKTAEDEKRAAIRAADARRKADPNSDYYDPRKNDPRSRFYVPPGKADPAVSAEAERSPANRTARAGVQSSGELGLTISRLLSGPVLKAASSSLLGIDGLNGRVSAQLQGLVPGPAKEQASARLVDKVHEIRLGAASLQGSADSVEDFLNQLQRAGLTA